MCGIAGIVRPEPSSPVDEQALLRMAARDPPPRARTGSGSLLDHGAGLVSTRLAIIDLPGGWQPLRGRS